MKVIMSPSTSSQLKVRRMGFYQGDKITSQPHLETTKDEKECKRKLSEINVPLSKRQCVFPLAVFSCWLGVGISEFVLSARTRHKKVGRVGLYQTNKMASQRHQEKMGGQCKIGSLQRNVSVRGSFVKISVTYLDTTRI